MNAALVAGIAERTKAELDRRDASYEAAIAELRKEAHDLRTLVATLTEKLAAIPAGADGRDGRDGAPGERGEKGEQGPPGERGTPGEPGAKGIDGRDGRDGKDGIASLDEIKAIASKAVDDRIDAVVEKRVAEHVATLPIPKYRDAWKAGAEYQSGDCVSWAGQTWIALEPTSGKPGDSKAWSLMVRRGRDAK